MINQFSRTELLLGSEAMDKLKSSRVAVIGLGAAGASCAEALARSAVGRIALFSEEIITQDMLGGSIIADCETLGKSAADVAKARLLSINKDIIIEKNPPFEGDMPDFSGCDYIVNASFDWDLTAELAVQAQKNGVPIISVLDFGELQYADAKFKIADVNKIPQAYMLAARLRRAGVKKHKTVYQTGDGSLSGVEFRDINACALGLIAAGEVIKDITGVRD